MSFLGGFIILVIAAVAHSMECDANEKRKSAWLTNTKPDPHEEEETT